MQFAELPEHTKRILFLGVVVVGVIMLIGLGLSSLASLVHPGAQNTASPVGKAIKVSPLLFGTNLDLSADQQQALPSAQESQLLQSLHVQMVRFSIPKNPTQKELLSMAQYVKSINATPLVALHGSLYAQALADNMLAIQTMNQVFGKTRVYYEYGDEDDAADISSAQYTSSWNTNIPQLKQLALNGQFIGPATYHYDPDYLRAFLQNAQPRPDAVSWHEFTCDSSWSKQQCMQGIGDWNKHIDSAHTIMKTISKAPLPIMITEWNYAANARIDDGKSTDNVFMTNWTKNALQTLAANNIFASMQYSGLKTSAPLISDTDQLTMQGKVMSTLYQQFVSKKAPSNPTSIATATPTATVSPTPTSSPTATPTPDSTNSTTTNTPTGMPTPTPTSPVSGTLPTSPVSPPIAPTPILSSSPTTIATVPTPTPTPTILVPTPNPTATPGPTPKPTPTPKPAPKSTTHAVDGKNPTTYTVGGKTCAATQSNSTAKAVTFGSVKGTLYFQFSITCHAAWGKIVFSKPVAAKALGNAKVVRTSDGKTATCNTGGNKSVAPGQTSCYTGMIYDGPSETASAYSMYTSSSGTTTTSARLGPF